ncbi:hypothetical protein MAPG_11137 [Magnaporthiopsis poae ATCC 64411]|uniref:Uncharacterized protein n=1 Tax=Magnaporthiopsis poae (strain ATCC 64411 / 73-15) TaxID=644358 RepID=A0A0C4EEG4_MAGP6|nr:hypothetical protein MAPG_11137 [Magnaporthiopsis poae ATCC 64411]
MGGTTSDNSQDGQENATMDSKPANSANPQHVAKPACPQGINEGKLGHNQGVPQDSVIDRSVLLEMQKRIDEYKKELQQLSDSCRFQEEQLVNAKAKQTESNRAYNALKEKADVELAKKNSIIDSISRDTKAKLAGKDGTIVKLQRDIAKLQEDALAHVDRHEPAFDGTVASAFHKVNRKINALVRRNVAASNRAGAAGSMREAVVTLDSFAQAVPLEQWGRRAVKPQWYDRRIAEVSQSDPAVRALMVRAMIWRFLKAELFDYSRPFAFLASNAADRLGLDFMDVFPNPTSSEVTAKWRALTAKCLSDFEANHPGLQQAVLGRLKEAFVKILHSEIAVKIHATPPLTLDLVRECVEAGIAQDLEPVLLAAIELAAITNKERALYQLHFVDLQHLGYYKAAEDSRMTTDPTPLGINARTADDDEDEEGPVHLTASPALVKWGNGAGERLDQYTILCKAFVWRQNRG